MGRRLIVDFHVHAVPPDLKRQREKYLARDGVFAEMYANPEAKLFTAEELVASMDRDGIDCAVVQNIGWITPELCVETNDYIAEAVRRFPSRLIGFGTVTPDSGDVALAEIERCAALGLRGIGELRPDTQGFDLTDETRFLPFCELIRQHNLILLLHTSEPVGHLYPGKGSVTPDTIYPFIVRHPEMTIVLAHWGGGLPFYSLMPEVKQACARVFYDTAASPFLYRPDIYRLVSEIAGAEHVLFGSDNPLIPPRRLLQEITSSGLPDHVQAMITGGNAAKLLDLG
jgi:predicted TIM-barrel fold metal-dependent hydrolase